MLFVFFVVDLSTLNPQPSTSMALSDLIGEIHEQCWSNTAFFAESVTATPPTGDPVSLKADVGQETIREEHRGGKRLVIRERTITFTTDASLDCGGIAASAPLINYKFTYGGRAYSVAEVVYVSEKTKTAQVRCEHVTEAEGPRPGLRSGPSW